MNGIYLHISNIHPHIAPFRGRHFSCVNYIIIVATLLAVNKFILLNAVTDRKTFLYSFINDV